VVLARKSLFAGAAGAPLLLAASIASANGRFPASNQLLFAPSDSGFVVLRTTFGVLLSHDSGATWSWLCEDALGLPPRATVDPSFGVSADDTLVAAFYEGLEVSRDRGCNWAFVGGMLAGQGVADVAVRPGAPHTIVAVESAYVRDGGIDGGTLYANQVYDSTDDGATWSPLGAPIDATVLLTTIDVAASDPHRLYVAGFRAPATAGGPNVASLFVSLDDGAHWTERALPPLVDELAAFIAAVDPADADRVYLRTAGPMKPPSQSRLMVTSDAGQSFAIPLAFATASGQLLGFALSPDGSKVYAGSPQDGLYVGARADVDASSPFHKMSSIHVQCLATRGAELWACSDEASGFIAGVSSDEGATFAARLHLNGIEAPVACAPDASASRCSCDAFQQLCASLGGCATSDACGGPSDASPLGGEPLLTPPSASGSGCSVHGRGGAAGLAAAAVAAFAAAARRRRCERGRA
jgi:hypothetical protein